MEYSIINSSHMPSTPPQTNSDHTSTGRAPAAGHGVSCALALPAHTCRLLCFSDIHVCLLTHHYLMPSQPRSIWFTCLFNMYAYTLTRLCWEEKLSVLTGRTVCRFNTSAGFGTYSARLVWFVRLSITKTLHLPFGWHFHGRATHTLLPGRRCLGYGATKAAHLPADDAPPPPLPPATHHPLPDRAGFCPTEERLPHPPTSLMPFHLPTAAPQNHSTFAGHLPAHLLRDPATLNTPSQHFSI